MRKLLAFGTAVFLFSCGGAASEVKTSPSAFQNLKQSGYRDGYRRGYEKGYETAYSYEGKLIQEYLKLWERDVLAYEVGRYAVSSSIVAPPKIYREGGGSVGTVETGGQEITPTVVEKLTPLAVPSPYFPKVPQLKTPKPDLKVLKGYPVPYRIGYLEGFSDGLEKGIREGKQEALKEFRKALSPDTESGKKFIYLELEKYYSPDLKITYPRIYKVVKGRKVKYYLVPSRVEDVRTYRDVLAGNVPLPEELKEKKELEGVGLPVQAEPVQLPGVSVPEPYRVEVRCGKLDVVSEYGVPVEVENDSCYAVFGDREQAENFCTQSGLCVKEKVKAVRKGGKSRREER